MHDVSASTRNKRSEVPTAFYSLKDTAALCGLSYNTLWLMVQENRFPVTPVKFGGQYKFPKRKIDEMAGLVDDGDNAA